MILGDPGIASVFGETVFETSEILAPASYPTLELVDKPDSLKVVVDGGRRRILILGNVLLHPGVAAISRYQDRCITEVLQRDKAVSRIEELNLPAPLATLEVLDIS